MIAKSNYSRKATFRRIAVISLFLFLASTLNFSQEPILPNSSMNFENEWWYPIIKKHNKEIQAFNNYERVFEMGTSNSISNGIVTLENSCILIRAIDNYLLIESSLACHDLNTNIITVEEGTIEEHSYDLNENEPIRVLSFKFAKLELDNKGRYNLEVSQ